MQTSTALLSLSCLHACLQMLVGAGVLHSVTNQSECVSAALERLWPCRNVSGACAMLPASAAALYGGCAFNDAAAMSATVSRLEGDLARAKAALTERLATEDIQLRQRQDLKAEVTRLHAEVGHSMLSAQS